MNQTGIIILAAGNSSRLGHAKQILIYQGKTLLQHIVNASLEAYLDPIVIVIGAYAEQVSQNLNNQQIQIVNNSQWQQGIASSIAAGMSKMIDSKNIENIIIAVCDQPFINSSIFQQLINERKQNKKGIIACSYADTIGTPVLFSQKYFEELLQLKGHEGAKKLLQLYKNDVAVIPFTEGSIDIDTMQDYESLLNVKSEN